MSFNATEEECEGRETFPLYLLSLLYSILAVRETEREREERAEEGGLSKGVATLLQCSSSEWSIYLCLL